MCESIGHRPLWGRCPKRGKKRKVEKKKRKNERKNEDGGGRRGIEARGRSRLKTKTKDEVVLRKREIETEK